jgi:hypothetical protein
MTGGHRLERTRPIRDGLKNDHTWSSVAAGMTNAALDVAQLLPLG